MKILGLSLIGLGTALTACSGNSATPAEYDDVAQSVGASTASQSGDVGAMVDLVAIAHGTMPLGFTDSGNGVITGTVLGLDYSYMITCKNASGTVLAACDSTTDSANVSFSWDGMITLPAITATITREGNWSVSGLTTTTATFNGNGTFVDDAMIANTSYHFDTSATYSDVAIDTGDEIANNGEIQLSIDGSKQAASGSTSFSVDADITIHADATATIILDGQHDYTLNLTTGVVTAGVSP
ncbi:MAG TPA: hypothetical protein VGG28_07885 [Kofleriaceae bacterium]|jgi:hypothetical protein